MKTRKMFLVCGLVLAISLGGCSKDDSKQGGGDRGAKKTKVDKVDPLSTPKGSLKHQFELLKVGDVEGLRTCMTKRQRERITSKMVEEGRKEVGTYAFEDLWAKEEMGEYQGQETCKVWMKNGRTLTTLVLIDGKWLADTIWFH